MSIIISTHYTGSDIFDINSYNGRLSHFYFISLSIVALAVAEIVEVAIYTDRPNVGIAIQTLFGLLLMVAVVFLYVLAVQQDLANEALATLDLITAGVVTFISAFLGLRVRSQLAGSREAG